MSPASYQKSILAAAIIISIPAVFFILVGMMNSSLAYLVFWGAILLLCWASYLCLAKGGRLAFWLSFALVNILWWPLLWRTGGRVIFVVENGGMESVNGQGSPLAFLVGVVIEQLLFIPLSVAMIFGVLAITNFRQKKTPR